MGCSASGPFYKAGGIRLMTTRLTYSKDQLNGLNAYFRNMLADRQNDSLDVAGIEATVERLVQRLMLGAGYLDSRFSSVFLVSLNEPRRVKQLRFEYLLRIDELSTPGLYPEKETLVSPEEDETMPGFVRLRILASGAESWHEYADARGRLRRDLVKAKFANLLAAAVKRDLQETTDQAIICNSPGLVVDADVLDKILKQPDYCRPFYGPAISDGPLPKPRSHRIALIEDAAGILLRIGLDGYGAREIEVRLLIGIGLSSWSSLADYPRRVPLYHCDALLHYTSGQTGMYAVGVGPYTGTRCEDRASLWRIRVPAAEKIMNQHYAEDTVPTLTGSVLMEILYRLREGSTTKQADRLRLVSRHILRTIHRWSLERAGPDPLTAWAPDTLARHVLLSLDELVAALKRQSLRCYIHPRCNVILQSARGGVAYPEDSYLSDARTVESYLSWLHRESFHMDTVVPRPLDLMESELIVKWRDVMASLPRGTMSGDHGYSPRQLEYFALILEEVLRARDASSQDYIDDCSYLSFPDSAYHPGEQIESLVYLVRLILRQARDQIYAMSRRKRRPGRRRRGILGKRRRCNTVSQFDCSVGLLVDFIRGDRETASLDLDSGSAMARTVLQWLYFAVDYDRKVLEPILRPYLANLFNGLHQNGFYADSFKRSRESYALEMRSLASFCRLVTVEKVSPASALVDFLSDGWRWAESMVNMIERSGGCLGLVFLTQEHKIIRYGLRFADDKGLSAYSSWSKARTIGSIARRRRSDSAARSPIAPMQFREPEPAGHAGLRDRSPLTYVVSIAGSRARHRGPGDLVAALISLAKFRILQEVAAVLPRDERVAMLDMVQRVARESSRRPRKSSLLQGSDTGSPRETYRPRPESDVLEPVVEQSPSVRILAEHQRQLQKEMQQMHDTLRRNNLRPRQRPPLWDSNSVSSWTSSLESTETASSRRRRRRRKDRVPIWNTISYGGSSIRGSHGDVNCLANKFEEMISREESPRWSSDNNRRQGVESRVSRDQERLPSWDDLEAALNKKLCNYGTTPSDRSIAMDYLNANISRT